MMIKLSEHQEQKTLITWFRLQYPLYARCLFAIPNGGMRNKVIAVKLKAEGVTAGVSDLFLMIPRGGKHGLFIEMKALDGKPTEAQKEFIALANLMNYQAVICKGFDEAKKVVANYISGA